MPKHNNAIPRNHFHKHWNPESSQKGHIKTFFQQAQQKKARRVRRQAKARAVFPKPAGGCIRPVVQYVNDINSIQLIHFIQNLNNSTGHAPLDLT